MIFNPCFNITMSSSVNIISFQWTSSSIRGDSKLVTRIVKNMAKLTGNQHINQQYMNISISNSDSTISSKYRLIIALAQKRSFVKLTKVPK